MSEEGDPRRNLILNAHIPPPQKKNISKQSQGPNAEWTLLLVTPNKEKAICCFFNKIFHEVLIYIYLASSWWFGHTKMAVWTHNKLSVGFQKLILSMCSTWDDSDVCWFKQSVL